MRADINLSVRPVGQVTLGTRTEIKNMNSFRAIRQAIDGEAARQIALLAAGGTVIQETRRWDDEKGISISMRAKESVRDYRYFPDPDLQDVFIDEEWIAEVYRSLPELPAAKRERYRLEYGLSPYDAEMLTGAREIADLFEQAVKSYSRPKEIANQIITEVGRLLTETATPPEQINLDPVKLAQVARMVVDGRINRTTGREVLELVFREDVDPIRYVEEKDLAMVDDRALIGQAVSQVLLTHEKSVADYKSGKEKAFRFLVGQVMRELKGRADPALVNQVLRDQLQRKCE